VKLLKQCKYLLPLIAICTVDAVLRKVINMARRYNENQSPLVKIVYSKVKVHGKVELVAMELYADGSLKRIQ
jgi:hypothetical protein